MSKSRDFTNKNTKFTGSDGIVVPAGSTSGVGPRPGSPDLGTLRYNTDLGLAEFYTATGWAGVDAPPTVSNVSGTINENTDSTITITGTGFKNGSLVYVTGAGVSAVERSLTTTYVNQTSLTAVTNAAAVNFVGGATFGVKVLNPSGLAGQLDNVGSIDRDPVWSTGAGSLGTVTDATRSSASFTVAATDPDTTSVTFSLVSGSLPAGASLGSSNGVISGPFTAVASNTTSSFTLRATSNGQTADRAFSITVDAPVITFNTASGSIGTIYDGSRSNLVLSAVTASASSGTVSYSIPTGALPTGLSLNSSTGAITGTAGAVGSDTTSTFTVRATTTSASATSDRSFSITVRAPVVTSFTSTGGTTFSVPTGVNSARVLVVAGGGAGGTRNSGTGGGGTDGGAGAGAGGMIDVPSYPLTPGGSVSVTVGGGAPANTGGESFGANGSNSVFDSLTAIGGGGGGAGPGGSVADGRPGGSGGGRGGGGSPSGPTGTGVQPSQGGLSGTYGYGNPGGPNPNQAPYSGAGGGGAGSAGSAGGNGNVGTAGSGRNSDITGSTITYAGGGGGGGGGPSPVSSAGGGPGGGGPGNSGNGTANRGGGGGGGNGTPASDGAGPGAGGAGGPGIVIVRY